MVNICYTSGFMSNVIVGLSALTGNLFTGVLLIVILLLILTFALQMPMEMSVIFVLPFLLAVTACSPENMMQILFIALVYGGIIIAKNWLIK